jgi:hypothetical protein
MRSISHKIDAIGIVAERLQRALQNPSASHHEQIFKNFCALYRDIRIAQNGKHPEGQCITEVWEYFGKQYVGARRVTETPTGNQRSSGACQETYIDIPKR